MWYQAQLAVMHLFAAGATTVSLPTAKSTVKLPGLSTFAALVNQLAIAILIVGVLGFLGGGLYFVIEAKRGHGGGMHTGHRLVMGAAILCILVGGATKLVTMFQGAGAGL